MFSRTHFLLIAMLLLAGILTFFKVPMSSSQGVTIVAAKINDALPVADLSAASWNEATTVSIPLSAQIVARPLFPQARIKEVNVRAIYNEQQIAFLVEWADETVDDAAVRVQDFSDAVAIQFPLVEGQPFFCMGQQGGNVNIWHWKADWQKGLVERQDMHTAYPNMYVDGYTFAAPEKGAMATVADYSDINYVPALAAGNLFASATYSSPVEDLIAGSFGSLTSQPAEMQNVQGHGEYADGKWRVIFVRDLTPDELNDARFALGNVYSLAFAAWDGSNEERNGQKSTSQWVSLQLGEGSTAGSPSRTTTGTSGRAGTTTTTAEGMLFVFVPMLLLFGGLILVGFVLFLLSKLPSRS